MKAIRRRQRAAAPRGRAGLRQRGRILALSVLAIGAAAALPSTAGAQQVWIRWKHPAPRTVASFTIHVGSRSGVYDYTVDVGKPKKDADGVFQWPLDFGGSAAQFVAISALGKNGLRSELSNEGFIFAASSPLLGQPGAPTVEQP